VRDISKGRKATYLRVVAAMRPVSTKTATSPPPSCSSTAQSPHQMLAT
jgi:hypothetical protein